MKRGGLCCMVALLLSACHAASDGTPIDGSGGHGNGTGATTGGSGAVGAGTGGSATVAPLVLDCPQPALGRPLMRLLTRYELQNTLSDVFPEVSGQWSSSLPSDNVSSYGFDNDESQHNTAGTQFVSALGETAASVAAAVTGNALAGLLPCANTAADRACADQFLVKYGRRLFRRPLTPTEHNRYLTFFDSALAKSDFKTALKWMTAGLIQSPNTTYRSETGADKSNGTRELTSYELATSLAYTYTGSGPSDALIAQAEAGSLGDPVVIARSLLTTERGKSMLHRFFDAYAELTDVRSIQRPNVSAFGGISADMAAETRAFVNTVVFQNNGGVKELLTAATTNPSRALASYYGFPAPPTDFASISRPSGRGVGLLAQGAFLATHASADSSSPTRRGLFQYRKLFCQTIKPPEAGVPPIGQPQPGVKTTRQRYEESHAQPGSTCAGCHHRFDPMGFGLEHFDEGGRYRDTENGLPINSAGTVLKPDGSMLFSFAGQEDLAAGLANQPVVQQCFAAYLATYAFGTTESCLGASSVPQLQAGSVGIAEAFARLAAEPHFSRRTAQ